MSDQFSGTKDVADNLAFSLDNLNSYLESACPEVERINSRNIKRLGRPCFLLKSTSNACLKRCKRS